MVGSNPACCCQDLSRCKKVMEERGELFLEKISMSRTKVAKLCHTFIKDGAVGFILRSLMLTY